MSTPFSARSTAGNGWIEAPSIGEAGADGCSGAQDKADTDTHSHPVLIHDASRSPSPVPTRAVVGAVIRLSVRFCVRVCFGMIVTTIRLRCLPSVGAASLRFVVGNLQRRDCAFMHLSLLARCRGCICEDPGSGRCRLQFVSISVPASSNRTVRCG